MSAKISLLLPTRERPAIARRFFDSVVEKTADLNALEIVLYIDDDDDISSHALDDHRINLKRLIGPRSTMGACLTACLEQSDGEIIFLVNDDMMIRTPGWDKILVEFYKSFNDRIFLAYGNDMFKSKKVCTFPIVSRKTCEVLSKPYPEEYRASLIDYHLFDIFKRLQKMGHDRIYYFKNLIFEHLHYRTGKAAFDTTYQKRDRFGDDGAFIDLRALRSSQAQRLRSAINGNGAGLMDSFERNRAAFTPGNLAEAVPQYAKAFLSDDELPLLWRFQLFIWFCGRFLASKGHLSWYEKLRDKWACR